MQPDVTLELHSSKKLVELLDALFEFTLSQIRCGEVLGDHLWSLRVRQTLYQSYLALDLGPGSERPSEKRIIDRVRVDRGPGAGPALATVDMAVGTKLYFDYDVGAPTQVVLKLAAIIPGGDGQPVPNTPRVVRSVVVVPTAAAVEAAEGQQPAASAAAVSSRIDTALPLLCELLLNPTHTNSVIIGRPCADVQACVIEHPPGGNGDMIFAPERFPSLDALLASLEQALRPETIAALAETTRRGWIQRFVFPAHRLAADAEAKLGSMISAAEQDDWYGPRVVLCRESQIEQDRLARAAHRQGFNVERSFPRTAARLGGPEATGKRYSWFSLQGDVLMVYASEMDPSTRIGAEAPIATIQGPFASADAIFQAVEQAWPAVDERDARDIPRPPFYWATRPGDAASKVESRYMRRKIQDRLRTSCADHAGRGFTCNITGAPTLENAHVLSVQRIENRELWRQYATFRGDAKLTRAQQRRGEKRRWGEEQSRPIRCQIEEDERFLFHGTNAEHVNSIAKNGLLIPEGPGSLRYGKGIYFTDESCKSHQYTRPAPDANGDDIHCLIYCRVSLGSTITYRPRSSDRAHNYLAGMRMPTSEDTVFRERLEQRGETARSRQSFDSVVVEPNFGGSGPPPQVHREIVVFNPAQVYPEYVVYYRVQARPSDRPATPVRFCKCVQRCRRCQTGKGRISAVKPLWFDCWALECDGHPLGRREVPDDVDDILCDMHYEDGLVDAPASCVNCKATGIRGTHRRRDCRHCDGKGVQTTSEWTQCFRCSNTPRSWGGPHDDQCTMCAGRRKLLGRNMSKCFKCEAKGRYETVDGSMIRCGRCVGKGFLTGKHSKCSMCSGDGAYETIDGSTLTCTACGGGGALEGIYSPCFKCSTRGVREGNNGELLDCEVCFGKASLRGLHTKCFKCEGNGVYPQAPDDQEVNCDVCNGKGTRAGVWSPCSACQTTGGNCHVCKGDGGVSGMWTECSYCEGDGTYTSVHGDTLACGHCAGLGHRAGCPLFWRQCDLCYDCGNDEEDCDRGGMLYEPHHECHPNDQPVDRNDDFM